jgi:transcriptional regulator with XRE-family HTH domain
MASVQTTLTKLQSQPGFQAQVARKIGVSPSMLCHVFKGRKGLGTAKLFAMAKELGIKPEDLHGHLERLRERVA